MNRYLLLTIGYKEPTPELIDLWMSWFNDIQDSIISQGGCMNGRVITPTNVHNLPKGLDSITGYLIIKAANINEAEDIAKKCPMITATRVYEIRDPS